MQHGVKNSCKLILLLKLKTIFLHYLLSQAGSFLWASVRRGDSDWNAVAESGAGHMHQCQQGCEVSTATLPEFVSFNFTVGNSYL